MPRITSAISFDWKDSPEVEDIQEALKPFGVFVYENPTFEADDCYCVIFTRRELNEEQLAGLTSDVIDEQDDIFQMVISTTEQLSTEELDELSLVGVYAYVVDMQDDSYGFLLSNEELTEDELEEELTNSSGG